MLASIPTTIVPAALGVWWNTPPDGFDEAMAAVPAGMLVDAAFLWSWRVLPKRLPHAALPVRLAMMAALSLALWFLLAAGFVLGMRALDGTGWPPLGVGMGAQAVLLVAGGLACRGLPPAPKGTRAVSVPVLLGRGALAATAITVSVGIAAAGAPMVGGIASVFPAIFLTTMVSLWLAQGEAVPVGAVGPIMLGSSSVGAFALLATLTFPTFGPWIGSAVAWVAAVACTSLPAGWWLTRPTQET